GAALGRVRLLWWARSSRDGGAPARIKGTSSCPLPDLRPRLRTSEEIPLRHAGQWKMQRLLVGASRRAGTCYSPYGKEPSATDLGDHGALAEQPQCCAAAGGDAARLHLAVDAAQLIADLLEPGFGHGGAIVVH